MYTYPKIDSLDKIEHFFNVISSTGVPKKFTYRYLAEIGFSSSTEREFIPLLLFLGLINAKSVPTPHYPRLLDKRDFQQVLSERIIEAYQELINLDKNVPNVPDAVLVGYFGRITGSPENIAKKMMLTLKELCRIAGFAAVVKKEEKKARTASATVNLSINLPTTTDDRVYENLFKHLKDFLVPQE